MKKLLIVAIMFALVGSSFGQMLAAGTSELKVAGVIDFDTANDTLIDFEIFYGQFVYDYIEAGLGLRLIDDDRRTIWQLGAAGEYNFDLGTELVPYLGLGLAYAHFETQFEQSYPQLDGTELRVRETEDDDAIVLTTTAGAKFFIAENIALSVALVLDFATEDIYAEEDEFEDTNAQIRAAMRFFF